ncbi:MAG: carbohydrate ABC transporter permease, partial [Mesotoga sp.]|nr:carbohydrate ABC transporter permease [Mesotoga sp.]
MSRARSKSISGVGDITKKGIIYLLLLAAAFFYLFPIYTAVNTSLKSNQELAYGPVNIVRNPEFANYLKAFSEIDKPIWNSFVITMVATA